MAKTLSSVVLRATATVCFLVGSIVMFASKQRVVVNNIEFVARDSDWTALLFFAIVNISIFGYNFLVMFIPNGSSLWKTIVLLDTIICILSGASLGVGWQTYLLFIQGNMNSIYANWLPICCIVPIFCLLILVSLILSTLGFALSFGLLVYCIVESTDAILVKI